MKTFSVEGSSPSSKAAAIANAVANAAAAAAGAKHLSIAISGVVEEPDGMFRVVIHVITHEDDEDLVDEDEKGDGESRGHAKRRREMERQRKRAERISQRLKEEMIHQFEGHAHAPDPAHAYEQGLHAAEIGVIDLPHDEHVLYHMDFGPDETSAHIRLDAEEFRHVVDILSADADESPEPRHLLDEPAPEPS
jgi:flavin-binding protein dodecin